MISGVESNHVSIIVVNWNGERFLKDCLGALSGQTYANYEIILVDNGSSGFPVKTGLGDSTAEARVVRKNRIFEIQINLAHRFFFI